MESETVFFNMIPPKLKEGDHVRVIAPSHSFAPAFSRELRARAEEGLGKLGLTVSYGKYVDELNDFKTATVEHRLEDLHEAFADPKVQAVIPARGGSSVTQLLKYIDSELIKNNPKILCGLSDITALSYALYAKTGVVNYYGPHYTILGASKIVDYSFEAMKNVLFSEEVVQLKPSNHYCQSAWDPEKIVNEDGFWLINEGQAEGKSIGGNFLTTNFLLGSEFMPDIFDSILFLEENHIIEFRGVQNELQSILNQPASDKIRGLVIGRFQKKTGMTRELLTKMVRSKRELKDIPVVANVDIGHTTPMLTFPIGGTVKLEAGAEDNIKIDITQH